MSLARILRVLPWWEGRLLAVAAGVLVTMTAACGLSAAQEAGPQVLGQPALPAGSQAGLLASPPLVAQAAAPTDSYAELRSGLKPFGYRLFEQLALTPPPSTGP